MCSRFEGRREGIGEHEWEIVDRFRTIIGDKGYDSDENHIVARRCGFFEIMPATNKGVPIRRTKGVNRKRMKRHLPEEYNRRPIVETVHSVVKRKSGSFAGSRIPGQLEKEMALKIIAYNIRKIIMINSSKIIFIIEDFCRAVWILNICSYINLCHN